MSIPMSVLRLHSETLKDEWVDVYGHLNQAYYLIPFSNASWAFQEYLGVGVPYFEATGCAIYTVESHIRYLREVRTPAVLKFDTIVFGFDEKRIHFAHILSVDGNECTTFECFVVHFDSKLGRTSPLPQSTCSKLKEIQTETIPSWGRKDMSERFMR